VKGYVRLPRIGSLAQVIPRTSSPSRMGTLGLGPDMKLKAGIFIHPAREWNGSAEAEMEDRILMPIARSSVVAIRNALPALVLRAHTINDVLLQLVKVLQPQIPGLWRLSVRRFLPQEGQLQLVAVWSASDTRLRAGTSISAGASSMPEVLKLDRPVFSGEDSEEGTFLLQVLATEGIRSWVSIPLRRGPQTVGLLSVSSMQPDAIDPIDSAFFEAMGKAVEARLPQLEGWEP
jgi:GAF domain-containing protein